MWDVIIAGCGPTGATLAAELRLHDVRVLVLEQRRPQYGAQTARRRLPRRAFTKRHADGRAGSGCAAPGDRRRPRDQPAILAAARRRRGLQRRGPRRGSQRPRGTAHPGGFPATAAHRRRVRFRRALPALVVALRGCHPAGRAVPSGAGAPRGWAPETLLDTTRIPPRHWMLRASCCAPTATSPGSATISRTWTTTSQAGSASPPARSILVLDHEVAAPDRPGQL